MTSTPKPKQLKPSAAHKRLEAFIGTWHAEGTSYGGGGQDAADPRAAGVPWISDESYEWLPGGFFVLHRWMRSRSKVRRSWDTTSPRAATSRACSTTLVTTPTTAQTLTATSGASQKRSRVPP